MNVLEAMAAAYQALENCLVNGNTLWASRWSDRITQLAQLLPSGSGFDNGSHIVEGAFKPAVCAFRTSFHHMDENGYYDGWTDHTVRVHAELLGLRIAVSGPNRNDIKDYIAEAFHGVLTAEAPPVPWDAEFSGKTP